MDTESRLSARGMPEERAWKLQECLERGKTWQKQKEKRVSSERKDTFPGSLISLLCPCTKPQQQGVGGSQDQQGGPCPGRCSELGLLTSSSLTQIRYRRWNLLSWRSD